jgi:pimeloyl-ACP methyl ester carboxylesterase
MTQITASDGTKIYCEEAGAGTPIVFVHEFAGDYRTWEPQMRYFSRTHRCITFSARGYPPSDVPEDPARYGQDIACDDVVAVMDALGVDKAHVGILHPRRCISVTAAGCGWGSLSDPAAREAMRKFAASTALMFTEKGMAEAAASYAESPGRLTHKYKDPRGFAEFARMLSEHSAQGHALTMSMVQARRPTLWDMEAVLRRFSVPLLVIVGDEDDACLEGSLFLKRTVPTAGLLVIPRSGHTITSEEPTAVNLALAELFSAAEAGRWLAHRPPA